MKSTSFLVYLSPLVIPAAVSAFTHANNSPRRFNLVHYDAAHQKCTALHLYRSAAEAIVEAKRICAIEGPDSERCAVAWDIVEELEAADSHVRAPATESYELSYVPLVQGLDILSSKIERKLGELKNLSTQMAEAGAGPEVERLIYASDEMKQILAEARAAMAQYR
mmetsp:Transcript_42383/g.90182  ORF Transcript_42383/g.90182 Transcript_42383/m.90182 type:complete len:166 (+) Transcript_42383:154-651(+)|eukprot:CAMPEP_0172546480 /NCGR_PEP_ID=MMETSP1067-20121228/16242_1 /TAXON_ID=265564 ORGANISM="Thalassiosira punctigera, Strain Tpunct2005C2" /NCGR_SAMPLE_ID=MMETSP1067 /ASSEMBLY_ACC=CAM_ASM_000444 /LENGTH=165 /DNA_ID=CAMNT_0013333419 /DNA_START=128 /DNA_END=625 /DNA_ORIENTATION=-